jgi:hypothetical protein
MTEAPEPKDKLDAATTVVVNGPEDAPFDWPPSRSGSAPPAASAWPVLTKHRSAKPKSRSTVPASRF